MPSPAGKPPAAWSHHSPAWLSPRRPRSPSHRRGSGSVGCRSRPSGRAACCPGPWDPAGHKLLSTKEQTNAFLPPLQARPPSCPIHAIWLSLRPNPDILHLLRVTHNTSPSKQKHPPALMLSAPARNLGSAGRERQQKRGISAKKQEVSQRMTPTRARESAGPGRQSRAGEGPGARREEHGAGLANSSGRARARTRGVVAWTSM